MSTSRWLPPEMPVTVGAEPGCSQKPGFSVSLPHSGQGTKYLGTPVPDQKQSSQGLNWFQYDIQASQVVA